MDGDQRNPAALWISITVVMLPTLYVLSIGPVAWFAASGTQVAVMLPYFPLILAASASEPTLELLNWYIHLWATNISVAI